MTSTDYCTTCFNTGRIDKAGAEVPCPDCKPLVRLTGLPHGLGHNGSAYFTAAWYTASTIAFYGTRSEVLRDVSAVLREARTTARLNGHKGRTSTTSWAIAIHQRVAKELAA